MQNLVIGRIPLPPAIQVVCPPRLTPAQIHVVMGDPDGLVASGKRYDGRKDTRCDTSSAVPAIETRVRVANRECLVEQPTLNGVHVDSWSRGRQLGAEWKNMLHTVPCIIIKP